MTLLTNILRKSVLTCSKAELAFVSVWVLFLFHEYLFISLGVSLISRISLYLECHFHPLYRHLGINRIISEESLPLRIGGSRT